MCLCKRHSRNGCATSSAPGYILNSVLGARPLSGRVGWSHGATGAKKMQFIFAGICQFVGGALPIRGKSWAVPWAVLCFIRRPFCHLDIAFLHFILHIIQNITGSKNKPCNRPKTTKTKYTTNTVKMISLEAKAKGNPSRQVEIPPNMTDEPINPRVSLPLASRSVPFISKRYVYLHDMTHHETNRYDHGYEQYRIDVNARPLHSSKSVDV
jgi:hypothetical protein